MNTETYTPGHSTNATNFMSARDLESHGFFLTPLLQPGFDVLDVGCGPGTITAGIADAVFPGRVTALDTSRAQIRVAERLAQGRELLNIRFEEASAYDVPRESETFDVVFAHALFEHLSNPAKALDELFRVTRPGGFAALCSPDWDAFEIEPFPARMREAIQAYRELQERNGGNTRAGASLRTWLAEAGFTPLAEGEWVEEYDDPGHIAEYLAVQLHHAGKERHAATLREWATTPMARFQQAWKYTTAVRADACRTGRRPLINE